MNAYQSLEFVAYVFSLGGNVVVAGVCFAAFRKLRLTALLLLAMSASIAVFTIFAEALLLKRTQDDSTYSFLWTGITILWLIDIVLYTTGVVKLVGWITRTGGREETPEPPRASRTM